jgi:hypothetical protein
MEAVLCNSKLRQRSRRELSTYMQDEAERRWKKGQDAALRSWVLEIHIHRHVKAQLLCRKCIDIISQRPMVQSCIVNS